MEIFTGRLGKSGSRDRYFVVNTQEIHMGCQNPKGDSISINIAQFCIQLHGAKAPKLREVMEGIIESAGPVCNKRSLRSSKMKLRNVSVQEFQTAATELQHRNLGCLKEFATAGRPAFIFIKRSPGDIDEDMKSNAFGHLLPSYTKRYWKRCPNTINKASKENLVSQGFIPQEDFNF